MNLLQKLNIRAKLVLIITATSGLSLLAGACVAYVYSRLDYQDEMVTRLLVDARLIAYNSTAAIDFDSPDEAKAGLAALKIHENIVGACIKTENGTLFATYLREEGNEKLFENLSQTPGHDYVGNKIYVSEDILLDGKRIGTIYLISDLHALNDWARRSALVGGAVLLCTTLLAFLLSLRFQRLISGPILELARTAKNISKKKDYSLRAPKHSDDELGMLADQFNEMLQQIQAQDDCLHGINEQLEERVRSRTEALQSALEEAEAASRAKGDFLANMSHELRTPLNGIVGMMELLASSELSNEQQERVQLVVNSADSLAGIVNDILDFSKIEAGKLELDPRPFCLDELVYGLGELLSVSAIEKGVDLFAHVDNNVPRRVVGDVSRVRQVLTNIVGNSVKFTQHGRILLLVSHKETTSGRTVCLFTVQDSGVGIEAKNIDSIFETFTQADASTTRKYGGTGLGLAITQRLVEMMDGSIGIESEYGQGTTVRFTLSFDLPEDGERDEPSSTLGHGLSILLIDDDPVTRNAYTENLFRWGFNVQSVDTVAQALSELGRSHTAKTPHKLVLINAASSSIDGAEAGRAIRGVPDLAPIPLIVTGFPLEGEALQILLDAGINQYLASYVSPSRLLDTIMTHLPESIPKLLHGRDLKPGEVGESTATVPSSCHILLVEDNAINQKVAQGFLEQLGLEATIANNGLEAVEMVREASYDIILMDVQMPVMDGYTATGEIRKNEKNNRIPIVAMTANAMPGDRERCLDAGMDDYITKPLCSESLRTVLNKYLGAEAFNAPKPSHTADSTPNSSDDGVPSDVSEAEARKPVFSRETALTFCGGNTDRLQTLITLALSEFPAQMTELCEAIEQRDQKTAERCVHTIKGQAAYLGAAQLQETALTGEIAARNNRMTELESIIPALRKRLLELCAVLQQEQSEKGSEGSS